LLRYYTSVSHDSHRTEQHHRKQVYRCILLIAEPVQHIQDGHQPPTTTCLTYAQRRRHQGKKKEKTIRTRIKFDCHRHYALARSCWRRRSLGVRDSGGGLGGHTDHCWNAGFWLCPCRQPSCVNSHDGERSDQRARQSQLGCASSGTDAQVRHYKCEASLTTTVCHLSPPRFPIFQHSISAHVGITGTLRSRVRLTTLGRSAQS